MLQFTLIFNGLNEKTPIFVTPVPQFVDMSATTVFIDSLRYKN